MGSSEGTKDVESYKSHCPNFVHIYGRLGWTLVPMQIAICLNKFRCSSAPTTFQIISQ